MHERTVRARTATGIVEGFTRDGVHRWRSIPYARAPVGSLRFRAPQPAQPGRAYGTATRLPTVLLSSAATP